MSPAPNPSVASQATVEVHTPALLLALSGPSGRYLRALENMFAASIGLRGQHIHLSGNASAVDQLQTLLTQLCELLAGGTELSETEILQAARVFSRDPTLKLRALFEDPVLVSSGRKSITPKGMVQKYYVASMRKNDVVFGVGPAGTGKTYLAMAMAVQALHNKRIKRIILTRPAVEAGEKLGFLPGDLAEKVNPYLRPLYDALHDMMDTDKVQHWMQRGLIEVAPLAFMRGRTLNDSFVVLDEAQNTTPPQMKMFLTRLGFNAKAVITGDITQLDLPPHTQSGLQDALALLTGIEGIDICYFSDEDVVRHPLVQRIVRAYRQRDLMSKNL